MSKALTIAMYCWAAGFASFVGAGAARLLSIQRSEAAREITHGVVAFGGGILMAAVAFALVPEGMALLPLWMAVPIFFVGSVVFAYADERLNRRGNPRSQLMAMILDYLPEAVSLGAVFPHKPQLGVLLAVFIGAQNLPEGFAAFREMTGANASVARVLRRMFFLSLLGPGAGLFGYFFLQSNHRVVGALMLLSGGGILYLVFRDIAPRARMKRHWSPTLGATLGFILGMVGERLLS